MKRIVWITLAIVLIFATRLYALEGFALNSGEKTSSSAILASAGYLTSVLVTTDGTNNAIATIYDNASSGSGTIIAKFTVPGSAYFGGGTYEFPIVAQNGIYLSISGTGAKAYIGYIKR